MERRYDLVVIGTGVASAAASRCREAGWSVAVVDSRAVGGTCALRGCRPKKILVAAAEAVHTARDMAGKGVDPGTLAVEWPALMRVKRAETDPAPRAFAESYARQGIDVVTGRARFVGPTALAVGDDVLVGRHVLIAAGAIPVPLPVPGAEHLASSEAFMELDRLPRRIVFVGGGYISFEFAHVAASAGAEVTIVHRGARPLEGFDGDLVGLLLRHTRDLGVRVEVDTAVEGVERAGDGVVVRGRGPHGESRFEADLAVHGAGRVPDLADLDLDRAGVARDRPGVTVNQYLQSVSNPAVYAAGDAAASGPPLTPKAGHDAEVVADNLLEGNHRSPDYRGLASAVFTVPALASVGHTEATASAQGLRVRTRWEDTSSWLSARRLNERASGYKILVDEATDRIVGAHLLGPGAAEVINVFAVAIRFGIPAAELKRVLFAYPTSASDIPSMV
jgi:glutathione reductase (NADPH)